MESTIEKGIASDQDQSYSRNHFWFWGIGPLVPSPTMKLDGTGLDGCGFVCLSSVKDLGWSMCLELNGQVLWFLHSCSNSVRLRACLAKALCSGNGATDWR